MRKYDIKEKMKKIPFLPSVYRILRNKYMKKNISQVFTNIYRENAWGGKESVSGPGSDIYQTRIIAKEIPSVCNDFGISTMLDLPCGDFHWMSNVDLSNISYIGADIVDELIKRNIEIYEKEGVHFQRLNLLQDELPKVDLVFCRDVLVHFSFKDIFKALNNICNSNSRYLLTTTFVARTENIDIETGQWRPINLEIDPFTLPAPIKIINEECTEGDGTYTDKSLGLWLIDDIRKSLRRHSI